jgi:hypothetical protein
MQNIEINFETLKEKELFIKLFNDVLGVDLNNSKIQQDNYQDQFKYLVADNILNIIKE